MHIMPFSLQYGARIFVQLLLPSVYTQRVPHSTVLQNTVCDEQSTVYEWSVCIMCVLCALYGATRGTAPCGTSSQIYS